MKCAPLLTATGFMVSDKEPPYAERKHSKPMYMSFMHEKVLKICGYRDSSMEMQNSTLKRQSNLFFVFLNTGSLELNPTHFSSRDPLLPEILASAVGAGSHSRVHIMAAFQSSRGLRANRKP
ncbi:hypothetical protein FKM82_019044 [Ascaphus truei]